MSAAADLEAGAEGSPAIAAPPAPEPLPPRPYVGMRPLDRDEGKLLFGRDDDVRFLCNKIFASPVTLLYAQSGVGKSSLLRSRTVAELKKQDAVVVYFENWTKPTRGSVVDPLKAALVKLLPATVQTANSGDRSILELVRRLGAKDDFGERHTVVLILDQLEEFLLQTADVEPLRRELALLLRSKDVDVRVVLSLREEFLAALEPFKSDVPQLFRSTYRLEPISDQAIAEAITQPAEWFGGSYDRTLPATILYDLAEEQTRRENAQAKDTDGLARLRVWARNRAARNSALTSPPPATQGAAEVASDTSRACSGASLPFVQLVCEKLWATAELGDKRMGLSLYRDLGGIRRILDAHVESVMPKKWRQRELAARLLVPLAPATGLKMSYAAAELAQVTERDADEVVELLGLLSKGLILRTREYGGSVRYELQHDALVGVVRPWRDEVLAEARRRKLLMRIGAVLAFLLLVGAYGLVRHWRSEREYADNTAALRDLHRDMGEFERATAYLLLYSKQAAARRFTDLEAGLRVRAKGLDHGGRAYAMQEQEAPPLAGREVRARVSSDYPLTKDAFEREWAAQSRIAAERWGIPLPPRIRLEPSLAPCPLGAGGAKTCKAILSAPGGPLETEVLWYPGEENDLVLVPASPEGKQVGLYAWLEARKLLLRESLPMLPVGSEEWWLVPRWTLPAWHAVGAAGDGAVDRGSLLARRMAAQATRRPDLFITHAVTDSLVARVAQSFPATASEAHRIRGQRLTDDLVALAKTGNGFALRALPAILDFLATCGGDLGSEEVAQIWMNLLVPATYLPSTLAPAPSRNDACGEDAERLAVASAGPGPLNTVDPAPVELNRGIVVHLGGRTPGASQAAFESSALRVRRALYESRGLDVPIAFVPATSQLEPEEIAISVADGSYGSVGRDLAPLPLPATDLDKFLERALNDAAVGAERRDPSTPGPTGNAANLRAQWLSAETVEAILERLRTEPNKAASKDFKTTADWLTKNYSLTDLKILLRAVVSSEEPGNSVRYPEWLLASLVYWANSNDSTSKGDRRSVAALAAHLRRLQAAAADPPAGGSCPRVDEGIDKLRHGDACGAQRAFHNARADECFVRGYASSRAVANDPIVAVAGPAPAPPTSVASPLHRPAVPASGELTSLLAWRDLVETPLNRTVSDLAPNIWLFQRHAFNPTWQADVYRQTMTRLNAAKLWPTTPSTLEFFRLALAYMSPAVAAEADVAKAAIGQVLHKNRPVLTSDRVGDALDQLFAVCGNRLSANWCRGFLFSIVKEYREDLDPWTIVASIYASLWRDQDLVAWYGDRRTLEQAVELAETAAKLGTVAAGYARYERSVASEVLTQLATRSHPEPHYDELEQLVTRLMLGPDGRARLAGLALGDGDAARALRYASDPDLKHAALRYYAHLDLHHPSEAVQEAALIKSAPSAPAVGQLAAALSEALLEDSSHVAIDRYLGTPEEQVPLVAALAVNRRPDLASDLDLRLTDLVAGHDLGHWTAELELGRMQAWQEMLVALYLRKLPWEKAFSDLEHDEPFKSSAFRYLGRERNGLLCQARLFEALAIERALGTSADETRKAFDQVIAAGMKPYVEHHVARCILDATCRSVKAP